MGQNSKINFNFVFHFKFFISQDSTNICMQDIYFTEQSCFSLYKPDEGVKETIFLVFPLWNLLETLRHDAERICTQTDSEKNNINHFDNTNHQTKPELDNNI